MKTAKKIIAGDRTDQIEMAGGNTILGARDGHTYEFERSEIAERKASPVTHAGIFLPERKKSAEVFI